MFCDCNSYVGHYLYQNGNDTVSGSPGAVLSDHFKRQYSSHRNISAPVQCRILRDPGPDNRRWQTDRGIYLCTFAALHALDGRIPSHIPPQKLPRRADSMTGLRAPTAAGMLSRPPPFSCGYPFVICPRSHECIHPQTENAGRLFAVDSQKSQMQTVCRAVSSSSMPPHNFPAFCFYIQKHRAARSHNQYSTEENCKCDAAAASNRPRQKTAGFSNPNAAYRHAPAPSRPVFFLSESCQAHRISCAGIHPPYSRKE